MEIPYSAISAEARALAAETALLVKKYGVLEEQVFNTRGRRGFSSGYLEPGAKIKPGPEPGIKNLRPGARPGTRVSGPGRKTRTKPGPAPIPV